MESQLPADAPKYRPTSESSSPEVATQVVDVEAATATVDHPASNPVVQEAQKPLTTATPVEDPIAESPESVWYVRPTAGGQYGPARGEVMRRWLTEGRVSADSMVWREGWADWKLAGPVFPSLEATPEPATTPAPKLTEPAPSFLVPGDEEQDISKPVAAPARRVTGKQKSILPLAILGVLIVVLLVVTFIILQSGGS